MTYLQAAFKVLKEESRPLSAQDIVELAQQRRYITPAGETPEQTMKARLSTEIVENGDGSTFMRTDLGVFALREWKDRESEYIARRFKKRLFDEDILVVPRASLSRFVPRPGLWTDGFDHQGLLRERSSTFDDVSLI